MFLKRLAFASATAITLLAAVATAHAAVRGVAVRAGNFTFNAPGSVAVPLNGGGATTISFNSTTARRAWLTYTAECSVDAAAGNNGAWVNIDIVFNGVTVPPTAGNSDAFCSANGTVGFDGFTRVSISVPVDVVVGGNTIAINASLVAGGTGGWLGDTTLAVVD